MLLDESDDQRVLSVKFATRYSFGNRPQNRIPITGKGAHDGVGDVMDAFSAPAHHKKRKSLGSKSEAL